MSDKLNCPGCNGYGSDIYQAVMWQDGACPRCGLDGETIQKVNEVREARGSEALRAELAEALLAVGKDDAELLKLREFARQVREALAELDREAK